MNSEKNNIDMSNVINKLFEGDCLEYMKKIPAGSVDMILCDLPYGMTQNKEKAGKAGTEAGRGEKSEISDCT